ncbi:MAG: hypothetical protein ACRD3C_17395 [Vicinamibacterales bacterium]
MLHRAQHGRPRTPGVERPRRVAARRGVQAGALLKTGAVLALGLVLFMPLAVRPVDTQAYYLGMALCLLTLLPLAVGLVRGNLDVFEPIIPVSLLIGLAFGIRAMYLVYDPAAFFSIWLARVSFDDFLSRAVLLSMGAYGALLAGYYLVAIPAVHLLRSRRYVPTTTWPLRLNGAKLFALVAVALLATTVRIGSGEIAGAGQSEVTGATFALGILSALAQYAACILALHIAGGDDRRWLRLTLWFGVLPLAAFQALAFAGKAPILLALYAVMAARHYAKRRLSVPLLAAGAAVAVLVVFPTVNAFRIPSERSLTVSSTGPNLREFASRVAAIPSLFAEMSASEYVRSAAESMVGRANGVDSLAVIMKYGEGVGLGNQAAYWQIPLYAFVPRAIWPEKPVILTGSEFARLFVTPREEGLREYPSIGVFHVGDLYASFGAGGVLIGMCALGFLFRVIYHFFDPARSPDLGMKFVYIILLWNIVNGFEADIPTIYGNLLKSLLIWGLIKMWLNARAGRTAAGYGPSRVRPSVVTRFQPRARFPAATTPR